MKTLMRNGRDRRSENPFWATRYLSACFWLRPISGSHQGQRPQRLHRAQAILRAKTGRIHGCTRTLRKEVRFFPCTAGAVHTWHSPYGSKAPDRVVCELKPLILLISASPGRSRAWPQFRVRGPHREGEEP